MGIQAPSAVVASSCAQPVNHATRTPLGQARVLQARHQIPVSAHATLDTLLGSPVFQPERSLEVAVVQYDWETKMVCAVLLRSITAAHGALCVMIPGITWTRKLCPGGWASLAAQRSRAVQDFKLQSWPCVQGALVFPAEFPVASPAI